MGQKALPDGWRDIVPRDLLLGKHWKKDRVLIEHVFVVFHDLAVFVCMVARF